MLKERRAGATIPASDIERAKAWYRDKLGLEPTVESEAGLVYGVGGGTMFLLYPTEHAGKAPNTLMTFESTDVVGDVAALRARGVVFMDIDEDDLKTVGGVASIGDLQAAWFNDSEGNILAIGNAPI